MEIKIKCERVTQNPHNKTWRDADHYRCVLRTSTRQMTLYFSKGYGHKGAEPTAAEVMDCILRDAASIENLSYEEWKSEMGFAFEHEARKTHKILDTQTDKLRSFLGEDRYREMINAL